ncbi:MAG: hypothetical protein G8237_03245 [Magnetococcales bacterium]|nr:hypothetical protein [Magnetococcales bacterium]NGZ05350.1 hypothetical protein [Magnetococcales bacterium]
MLPDVTWTGDLFWVALLVGVIANGVALLIASLPARNQPIPVPIPVRSRAAVRRPLPHAQSDISQ